MGRSSAFGRPPGREGDDPVLTVGALLRQVRRRLESDYDSFWVEGEIADLARPRSGHLYFALHDEVEEAVLRAVMWASDAARLRFRPEEGMRVRARGTLTLYEARGAFQMRVSRLQPGGAGDLRLRFEQVRARLEAQGLLDPSRKRPLPTAPRRLGIVTSRDGAALRDILKVLAERLPVPVLLVHASVQGEAAPAEIAAAFQRLAVVPDVDLVIAGRGGGSADELWVWNEEVVALAIAQHPAPVISAVGHETDVTIADLVADRRAATPTEAATMVAPTRDLLARSIEQWHGRLVRAGRYEVQRLRALAARLDQRLPESWRLLGDHRQKCDDLARLLEETARRRLLHLHRRYHVVQIRLAQLHPSTRLERRRASLRSLDQRLNHWAGREPERLRADLSRRAAQLEAISPLRVLGRGYALARTPSGEILRDASRVPVGQEIEVRLFRGLLGCAVQRVDDGE